MRPGLATFGACFGPRHDARHRGRHWPLDLWKLTGLPAFGVLALKPAFAFSHAVPREMILAGDNRTRPVARCKRLSHPSGTSSETPSRARRESQILGR